MNRHKGKSPQDIHRERVKGYRILLKNESISLSNAKRTVACLRESLDYINQRNDIEPIPKQISKQFVQSMLFAMLEVLKGHKHESG